jgi:hypothetical protein
MTDQNLTPSQRVWKRRRTRWSAWKAEQDKRGLRFLDVRRTWDATLNMSEADERRMLKAEGEQD